MASHSIGLYDWSCLYDELDGVYYTKLISTQKAPGFFDNLLLSTLNLRVFITLKNSKKSITNQLHY
jgi:hypothetical protein